jgi:hypothetical protein
VCEELTELESDVETRDGGRQRTREMRRSPDAQIVPLSHSMLLVLVVRGLSSTKRRVVVVVWMSRTKCVVAEAGVLES